MRHQARGARALRWDTYAALEKALRVVGTAFTAGVLLAWTAAAPAQPAAWRPDKTIEIIAPATPGGLHDITARSLQHVLQVAKLVAVPTVVVNKGGAGGTLGWTYLNQQQGDAHYIAMSAVNLLTNEILGASKLSYTDFTSLTILFHEYLGLAVRTDSPMLTGKEVAARLAKDPASMSIAIGTSLGNTSHLALARAVKAMGGDTRKLKTIVFGSNGEAMTALLGGHVDAIVTSLPNLVRHLQAKSIRVLAISSPQRIGGIFSAVPTWREEGVDVLMSGWRGVIGPKGLTPPQIAYWDTLFSRLRETEEWKQELAKNFWHPAQMNSQESRQFLDREYQSFQQVLNELGMAKKR
jgi:putative tricarboxylic transport membrane protein